MNHETESAGVFVDGRQPVEKRVAVVPQSAYGVEPVGRFHDAMRRAEGIALEAHRAAPGSILGLSNDVAVRGLGV